MSRPSRSSEAIRRSRLYLVCESIGDPESTSRLLDAALRGGVDLIQLRDKTADDETILATAPIFRKAADRHGALFLINDRPDLVAATKADGVHVGQDDIPVGEARRLAGPDAIVGLSTHGPEQLHAANATTGEDRPDYISVGPVWATPTKPGRPAAGLDYVRTAAAEAELPWFAIGGIDTGNVDQVLEAGATRIVVVRAIRDAPDPEAAATELRDAIAGELSVTDLAAEAEARGLTKSEIRNQRARDELEPLAEGERPLVVTIGAVLSILIAASILIAWLAGVEVQVGNTDISERPSAFQVFPPAILFSVMGYGMIRARYWAVLGFQAVMAIIMIGAFLTLIAATSIFQAISTLLVLIAAAALFWFTVKALARIQMPEPGDRSQ